MASSIFDDTMNLPIDEDFLRKHCFDGVYSKYGVYYRGLIDFEPLRYTQSPDKHKQFTMSNGINIYYGCIPFKADVRSAEMKPIIKANALYFELKSLVLPISPYPNPGYLKDICYKNTVIFSEESEAFNQLEFETKIEEYIIKCERFAKGYFDNIIYELNKTE